MAYKRLITVDKTKVIGTDQTDFPTLFRTLKSTINTSGTSVTWVSGDKFNSSFVGNDLLINSITYTVATYTNDTTISLSTSAGTQTGVDCLNTPYLRTIANGGKVQNANGYDIGFYADSRITIKYNWEIERYISTTGEIIAWIKKTLTTGSNPLYYLSYGNPSITTDQSSPTNVWDSNYKGIWHLPNGTTLTASDSTVDAYTGTLVNTPTATGGQIGGGGSFVQSVPQYINFGNNIGNYLTGDVTLEAWVYRNTNSYGWLFSKTGSTATNYPQPFDSNFSNVGGGKFSIVQGDTSNNYDTWESTSSVPTGSWFHIAAWISNSGTASRAARFFINGVADVAINTISGTFTPTNGTGNAMLANRMDNNGFDGSVDEMRVSNSIRSDGWITTNYNNQSEPTTFYSIGAEVSIITSVNNSSNQNYSNNSDGWSLSGGTTQRTLTLGGGNLGITGGGGGVTVSFPIANSTLETLDLTESISGVKTFTDSDLKLSGLTSGVATLKAPGIASTYVVTLPEATTTLVGRSNIDTLTNKTFVSPNVTTEIGPTTDDGATLGDTSFKFSDLFLAAGAVINFQAGNTTITHSSNLLTLAGGGLTLAAGTNSIAPLDYATGTNLTTAATGAVEYDGGNLYYTSAFAPGRGVEEVQQRFRLTSAGSAISTIANFFGPTGNPSLVSGAEYEIEIECYYQIVGGTGAVTWTFVNSAAPTGMNTFYTATPAAGIVAPAGSAAATYLNANDYNRTTATYAMTASVALNNASVQYARFNIFLRNGAGTSLKIQATKGTIGTLTPLIGSNWRVTRLPAANVGTFSA